MVGHMQWMSRTFKAGTADVGRYPCSVSHHHWSGGQNWWWVGQIFYCLGGIFDGDFFGCFVGWWKYRSELSVFSFLAVSVTTAAMNSWFSMLAKTAVTVAAIVVHGISVIFMLYWMIWRYYVWMMGIYWLCLKLRMLFIVCTIIHSNVCFFVYFNDANDSYVLYLLMGDLFANVWFLYFLFFFD